MRWYALLPALLALASCSNQKEPLSPPRQGRLLRPMRFDRVGYFVSMSEPNAELYIVRDIDPTLHEGQWRWTGRNPTLRFHLPVTNDLDFLMDFFLSDLALSHTGPVTITWRINGREFATRRYTAAGQQELRVAVPAELLTREGDNTVSAEIDQVWRTAVDGRETDLGFILVRAGFVQ